MLLQNINYKFLLVFFLSSFLILISCKKPESIHITVKVINSYTKEPRIGDSVIVEKVKKPWYSMWQYIKVAEGITDSSGVVSFTIDKNKGHSFSSYGPSYPDYFGNTEYAERELNENEEIIIEVIPPEKKIRP